MRLGGIEAHHTSPVRTALCVGVDQPVWAQVQAARAVDLNCLRDRAVRVIALQVVGVDGRHPHAAVTVERQRLAPVLDWHKTGMEHVD